MFILEKFLRLPVLGIVRGEDNFPMEDAFNVAVEAGLKHIEIALNTPNAFEHLEKMHAKFSKFLCIGVGTVLSVDDCKKVIDTGAQYIVTPSYMPELIDYCREKNTGIFAGALTPTEVFNAWERGADMIKVFPSFSCGGPEYFKALNGPFNQIKFLAVGGIRLNNIKDYFKAGASGVAFGSSIFKKEYIRQKDFNLIKDGIVSFVEEVMKFV
ncbi:MAG: bifunctional 4-hydroxy-2-oxoglutarate aldolase/2-dehydro-3-deoxy-phosphogluconate aldolase [Candidatus Aureabacteria bacterium]|nr:bifunctional 4-hydroxy-2-oxoglutarate aldolase/2-dehydro-3-deoxy-phosphogluconate aldolase [Candidatus Auribacterota bacterium]